jgi:hypothetical protein
MYINAIYVKIARHTLKEPLISSESFSCVGKMRQIKAPIAGNSKAIAKIGNAELAYFNKQMLIHELIRGSLIR